jgi:hypothetical protein
MSKMLSVLVGVSVFGFVGAANAAEPATLTDQQMDVVTAGQAEPSNGPLVAQTNHNSGDRGASDNPNASAGPGYFLGQDTAEAVQYKLSKKRK